MKVEGRSQRSIWPAPDGTSVNVIDQTRLPHVFAVCVLSSLEGARQAIANMIVRGAPLIGATAAYGLALGLRSGAHDAALHAAHATLLTSRPTAVNLRWALDRVRDAVLPLPVQQRAQAAWREAHSICEEDVAINRAIGEHGLQLIQAQAQSKTRVNIMTHCNAGWLATVDYGTALAPIYLAFDAGIDVHVWVSETRPRNQGAALTAWELQQHGIAHTLLVDNAAGHLMQRGMVDMVMVGTDRVTRRGDVCNKIGTYLKALAAREHGVPFYVAAPSPSIDWHISDGIAEIPIEQRDAREVSHLSGMTREGGVQQVALAPAQSAVSNYGFDVTPAPLVTALITERGVCAATEVALTKLFA